MTLTREYSDGDLGLRRRGSLLFGGVKSEPSLERVRSTTGVVGIEGIPVVDVFISAENDPATDAVPWAPDVLTLAPASAET